MSTRMNHEQIAGIVEGEGLDYTILHQIRASQIADQRLATLWEIAYLALSQIEEMLDEEILEGEDDQ